MATAIPLYETISTVRRWVPSRYTVRSTDTNGDLILYNSHTGAIGVIPADRVAEVIPVLSKKHGAETITGILHDLVEGGFIVPEGTNELAQVAQLRQLTKQQDSVLQLILMPSETCNFRCTYCYESFQRGKMLRSVREGIKNPF